MILMTARLRCGVLLAAMMAVTAACAQSGVLLPDGADKPDASVLSLDEMRVSIVIDNGDAHVSVTQIFASHTDKAQEANYTSSRCRRAARCLTLRSGMGRCGFRR
jgi:hypothetical protein